MPTVYVISELQIKTIMRKYFTPIRIAKMKKKKKKNLTVSTFGKDVDH